VPPHKTNNITWSHLVLVLVAVKVVNAPLPVVGPPVLELVSQLVQDVFHLAVDRLQGLVCLLQKPRSRAVFVLAIFI